MCKDVSMVKFVWETLDPIYASYRWSSIKDSDKSSIKTNIYYIYRSLFNHETLIFSELHENVRKQFLAGLYREMLVHKGRLGQGGRRSEQRANLSDVGEP